MSETEKIFTEVFAIFMAHFFDIFAVSLLLSTVVTFTRHMCLGGPRRHRKQNSKSVQASHDALTPCDIHNECMDCAFSGTSYCWRVMKHE